MLRNIKILVAIYAHFFYVLQVLFGTWSTFMGVPDVVETLRSCYFLAVLSGGGLRVAPLGMQAKKGNISTSGRDRVVRRVPEHFRRVVTLQGGGRFWLYPA